MDSNLVFVRLCGGTAITPSMRSASGFNRY